MEQLLTSDAGLLADSRVWPKPKQSGSRRTLFSAAIGYADGYNREFLIRNEHEKLAMLRYALAFLALCAPALAQNQGKKLELKKGDHICLVGNELGERMQHHNFFEMLLHQRFPDMDLTVRNLCFPGDEPFERIRSKNFGSPDSHLTHSKASVILFFFGFNESFDGEDGLDDFKGQLGKLIDETRKQKYDGKAAPRIALISPIAFENTGNKNLPDGTEHNARLKMYTMAMREVAAEKDAAFANLFNPSKKLYEDTEERLTHNGSHLNELGYKKMSWRVIGQLFGKKPEGLKVGFKHKKLMNEIVDKNFHWFHRYRAVNGFSIYGDRGTAGNDGTYNNRDVMERERAILDQMAANRDARIWALASGKGVSGDVDDSNTLPFINTKTNVGGPNDKQRKQGKLGTLEYLNAARQKDLFKLADGYEINLVASEEDFPELANPVALQFDNKGRMWVATMESYPHWKPKTKMNDKILIFEDNNGDGKADKCITYCDGLHQPTGFEIGRNGAYIAVQPDILYVQDTDGDDVVDHRERKLVGFCSADSHHGIAAFEWGPGGKLYFQEGTFKFSQIESPYGLTRLHEAGVWHYDPKTEKFGVHISMAFANPWGHVFDRWGQNFVGDASPGFSYWAAPISGRMDYPYKHPGGSQHGRLAKMKDGQKLYGDRKYRHKTFYKKRTRPLAGCCMISSSHFPDDVQGNFLVTNCIGDRMVLNHEVREEGSGFTGKEVDPIVSCEDGNFRPVDCQIGPDGALYIVDWHNALIGHLQHNLRDPSRDHSHGRIWRVTAKGRPLVKPPVIEDAPIADLLELLKVKEDRTRYRVKRELAERKTEGVIPAVEKWVGSLDTNDADFEHHRLEALWMYQTHNVVPKELLNDCLNAKDHRARAAAVRVVSFWLDKVDAMALLKPRVTDPHFRVRLEAIRALSYLDGSDEVIELALGALDSDEAENDFYLKFTLDEAMRMWEKSE